MAGIKRRTSLYFAALDLAESAWLSWNALVLLLRGHRDSFEYRADFERKWTGQGGSVDAIAMPSARAGLYALMKSLNIGRGDEVLITGFTCEAVPEPIQYCGAKPVYVDVDLRRFGMLPLMAGDAITPRTRAIILQHTFGFPALIEPIVELARARKLFLIEDCALALGSRLNGRQVGTAGDASIFSFELSKTVTAGWGGMVQVNKDRDLARRVRGTRDSAGWLRRATASRRLLQAGLSGVLYRPELSYYSGKLLALLFRLGLFAPSATVGTPGIVPVHYLAAPADAQWRVLARQLDRIDQTREARRSVAAAYQDVLDSHGCGEVIPSGMNEVRLIRFPLLVKNRERFIRIFAEAGVEVGQWFNQPVACRGGDLTRYGYKQGSCPSAEFISKHVVNLPVHERMTTEDISVAVRCLDEYLRDFPEERSFIAFSLDDHRVERLLSGSGVRR